MEMYRNYNGSPILPDDDEQADMYCYAAEMLDRYGYKQYEISMKTSPGFESRQNITQGMSNFISSLYL